MRFSDMKFYFSVMEDFRNAWGRSHWCDCRISCQSPSFAEGGTILLSEGIQYLMTIKALLLKVKFKNGVLGVKSKKVRNMKVQSLLVQVHNIFISDSIFFSFTLEMHFCSICITVCGHLCMMLIKAYTINGFPAFNWTYWRFMMDVLRSCFPSSLGPETYARSSGNGLISSCSSTQVCQKILLKHCAYPGIDK